MRPMTPTQRAWWVKTRAKGRNRFVWVRGVCGFGLGSALFFAPFNELIQHGPANFSLQRMVWSLPLICVVFAIAGFVWGHWVWVKAEKKYRAAGDSS